MPGNKLTPIQIRMKAIKPKSQAEIEAWEKSRQMITEAVQEAKQIITTGQHPPQQQELVFFATDMTRTSPFFPISPKEKKKKDRPFLRDMTWKTSWGSLSITGEKLSIYDETVLLTLLQVVQETKAESFQITRFELCKRMDVKPATNTYNAIWESIKRMASTRLDLEINDKGQSALDLTGCMISRAVRDNKTGKLTIEMNPYFLSMFAESFVTQIDMKVRRELSGDVAKALYRFLSSQRPLYEKGTYSIDLLKLCVAVNLDVVKLSPSDLRKRIRKGLAELSKQGFIHRWQLDKEDKITLRRSRKKCLKKE